MITENSRPDAVRIKVSQNLFYLLIGALVFTVVMLIARQFDRQQSQMYLMSAQHSAADLGEKLSEAVEYEINKNLVTVQALAAFQKTHETFTHQEFLAFASELGTEKEGILSLQFAPDGVVKYVTAPDRNRQAIGHDLLADPTRSGPAFRAIETGDFMVTGPVDLVQGGMALIARKPLYTNMANGDAKFWGFATVILDFATLTDLFSEISEENSYRHALRHVTDDASRKDVIWGDPDVFQSDPYLSVIQLSAGNWELATIPVHGWPSAWPLETSFWVAMTILAGVLAALNTILLRKPEQLRQAIKWATFDLKQTEQKLRKAQRIAKIGSWGLNANNDMICSPEILQLLGLNPQKTLIPFDDFCSRIHFEDRERVCDQIEKAHNLFRAFECTFRYKKPDNTCRVFKMNGEADRIVGKNEQKYSGTLQDITAQAMNEERLRHAQKMEAIGHLTGGIAHDFNNLLAVILGNAELLELTLDHDQELLAEIQSATLRGSALTHRLLAYARKQPLSPKSTNLETLIRNMDRMLSRTIGDHININLEFEEHLWRAKVDSGQVEDALLNLAFNARDAMTTGGSLLVKCKNVVVNVPGGLQVPNLNSGRYVEVSVIDTGCGMTEMVRSRAIEPFFTTKGVGKGSGLGLSMICGFTRQSGGGMVIESQPNKGTKVRLYLPYDTTTFEQVEKPKPSMDTPQGNGELVLVVEDNSVVGKTLIRTLIGLGYRTLQVANVMDAKERLRTRDDIALILTDVVLPGGESGLDLVAEVDTLDCSPAVLIMSGDPLMAGPVLSDVLAKHTFIKKPFSRELLAQSLREKLDATVDHPPSNVSIVDFRKTPKVALERTP